MDAEGLPPSGLTQTDIQTTEETKVYDSVDAYTVETDARIAEQESQNNSNSNDDTGSNKAPGFFDDEMNIIVVVLASVFGVFVIGGAVGYTVLRRDMRHGAPKDDVHKRGDPYQGKLDETQKKVHIKGTAVLPPKQNDVIISVFDDQNKSCAGKGKAVPMAKDIVVCGVPVKNARESMVPLMGARQSQATVGQATRTSQSFPYTLGPVASPVPLPSEESAAPPPLQAKKKAVPKPKAKKVSVRRTTSEIPAQEEAGPLKNASMEKSVVNETGISKKAPRSKSVGENAVKQRPSVAKAKAKKMGGSARKTTA